MTSGPPIRHGETVTRFGDDEGMKDATAAAAPQPQTGWQAGFDELARRLRTPLLRYFIRKVGSEAVAEEMTQELFLRLLRRADLFELANVDGYVFEAAANLARDRARRDAARGGGLHVTLDAVDVRSEDPSAERVVEGRRRLEALMAAVEQLPPRTRTVLIMSRFEGMTYGQIARRLRISISAVEKHIMLALERLQKRH